MPALPRRPAGRRCQERPRRRSRSAAATSRKDRRVCSRTRPRSVTSQACAPLRSTATGRSAETTIFAVCGNARSYETRLTSGNARMRRSIVAASSDTRLVPSIGASAASTRSTTDGRAPVTSICRTAKMDVPRAAAYPPTTSPISAKPTRSDRPDGRIRASGTASVTGPLGSGRTAVRDMGLRASGTQPSFGARAGSPTASGRPAGARGPRAAEPRARARLRTPRAPAAAPRPSAPAHRSPWPRLRSR